MSRVVRLGVFGGVWGPQCALGVVNGVALPKLGPPPSGAGKAGFAALPWHPARHRPWEGCCACCPRKVSRQSAHRPHGRAEGVRHGHCVGGFFCFLNFSKQILGLSFLPWAQILGRSGFTFFESRSNETLFSPSFLLLVFVRQ